MQIRRSRHRGSPSLEPFPYPPPANPPFQSLDRPYLPTAHPNAPLGAGLCIFNKFQESSRSRQSRPAVAVKAAFRLPRKRCPRVYLCARSSQSTSALLPSPPPHSRPASSPFLTSLCLSPSALFCRSRILFPTLYLLFPLHPSSFTISFSLLYSRS